MSITLPVHYEWVGPPQNRARAFRDANGQTVLIDDILAMLNKRDAELATARDDEALACKRLAMVEYALWKSERIVNIPDDVHGARCASTNIAIAIERRIQERSSTKGE